jgi:hypothetical protein
MAAHTPNALLLPVLRAADTAFSWKPEDGDEAEDADGDEQQEQLPEPLLAPDAMEVRTAALGSRPCLALG